MHLVIAQAVYLIHHASIPCPLFPASFIHSFFLLPVFVFFLPIDDTLSVEVPAVGGNILSSVQVSCKVRHIIPSTLDFVRFDEDNASKSNVPKSTVPSSDS